MLYGRKNERSNKISAEFCKNILQSTLKTQRQITLRKVLQRT